ncbi:hypothetical protein AVDCRST_MAG82-746, partial [uncultured Rubrobacteraceae bacterium]
GGAPGRLAARPLPRPRRHPREPRRAVRPRRRPGEFLV